MLLLKPLMSSNNFSGRRRTTRSRTVVVDPNDLQDVRCPQATINAFTPLQNEIYLKETVFENIITQSKLSLAPQNNSMETRTFAFTELMNAFQIIEKRSPEDPHVVQNVLKRFKTNDELVLDRDEDITRMYIRDEVFPRILNNPFIRNDIEIATDIIQGQTSKVNKYSR